MRDLKSLVYFIFFILLEASHGSRIATDAEAQKKCKEYRDCPETRLCAIQYLQWPMNMSFPICVPRSYVEVKMQICNLPPQQGDCGARFIRWFYNKHTNKCSWFYFQGCRGNQNNFRSEKECAQKCIPESDNRANSKRKPIVMAARSPTIVSDKPPLFLRDRAYNSIIPPVSFRKTNQKELRRKRRLEMKKQKRLRKLRRKRRRGNKRRREGKVNGKGRKRRNKNRKKNRKRKHRKRKNRKRKGKTPNLTPKIDLSNTKSPSGESNDFKLVSIIDKTKDTMKSSIEKLKSESRKSTTEKKKPSTVKAKSPQKSKT